MMRIGGIKYKVHTDKPFRYDGYYYKGQVVKTQPWKTYIEGYIKEEEQRIAICRSYPYALMIVVVILFIALSIFIIYVCALKSDVTRQDVITVTVDNGYVHSNVKGPLIIKVNDYTSDYIENGQCLDIKLDSGVYDAFVSIEDKDFPAILEIINETTMAYSIDTVLESEEVFTEKGHD